MTIVDNVMTLVTGSTFFVPPSQFPHSILPSSYQSENTYSLQNETSTSTAKLFYTQVAVEGPADE